jgi:hypothetical protein
MERTPKRNTQEWREIFSDWRRSGESQRAFCRREGISISSFGYWYGKLKDTGDEQRITKIDGFTSPISSGKNPIAARAGGVQVDLSGNESEELLIRVFRALQAVS